MTQPIYLTDPVVAAAYHVAAGEWASVTDDNEAAWLLANQHGWPLDAARALPAAGFVHPNAPLPFAPFDPVASPTPAPTPRPTLRRSAPYRARAAADEDKSNKGDDNDSADDAAEPSPS